VRLQVALLSDLDRAFEWLYAEGRTAQSELVRSAGEKVAALRHDDVEQLQDLASDAQVIRLVYCWMAWTQRVRGGER
jgi:general secretion pathway protein E